MKPDTFNKSCGRWSVEVSLPYPFWLTLRYADEEILRGVRSDELRDLRYLLDRAIEAVEREGGET